MNSTACAINVVEESYQIGRSDDDWIKGVLCALRPALDRGHGLIGGMYDVSDPHRIRIRAANGLGTRPELEQIGASLLTNTPPELAGRMFRTKPYAMTSDKLRTLGGFAAIAAPLAQFGIVDMLDLNALNPNARGVIIGVPVTHRARLTRAEADRGARLAAHIAAAYRLREQLVGERDPIAGADAVLSPGARVEHATGEAKSNPNRMALRAAAEALDRARGKLRQQHPDEALALWRALVSARWTLFDHYESDGRRVLIARRNDPETPPRANLSDRTRQVLAYRALGHSLKVIAYELGLSTSTVHRELARGMAALGLRSPVELVRLVSEQAPASERNGSTH